MRLERTYGQFLTGFYSEKRNLGKLSITPGLRYDNLSTSDSLFSPSLGVTYDLFKKTILRAYVARGFSAPTLAVTSGDNPGFGYKSNPALKAEKVWSYQLGAETGELKYIWLKVAAFRHDITDIIVSESLSASEWTNVNKNKARRQGIEIEARTVPVYHLSLSAGTTFISAKDLETNTEIKEYLQIYMTSA